MDREFCGRNVSTTQRGLPQPPRTRHASSALTAPHHTRPAQAHTRLTHPTHRRSGERYHIPPPPKGALCTQSFPARHASLPASCVTEIKGSLSLCCCVPLLPSPSWLTHVSCLTNTTITALTHRHNDHPAILPLHHTATATTTTITSTPRLSSPPPLEGRREFPRARRFLPPPVCPRLKGVAREDIRGTLA
ncbi:hypothetical protein E2C01_044264 [Portunus trituberculatus]|uniref:Uncharacterized protein n=1 Tax=Portunus trituberculatus TaxID=210409 RepID=A0A5B7FXY2_PORTR|nr:hypothetical protein [Portunus trituberculatus]